MLDYSVDAGLVDTGLVNSGTVRLSEDGSVLRGNGLASLEG